MAVVADLEGETLADLEGGCKERPLSVKIASFVCSFRVKKKVKYKVGPP